ncbi:oligosaccharide flippase family protein [Aquabacterium sp. J223]|uniref:oligosaccharide flippase family protein n=1 Tax=Aquabacterium sp. J223 TaxID=2898431 RepID=UPI0021ADF9D3|nr:oligosaccharide flippase family protein [Aquabacterium sp. J223]UUX96852.1 oligosaccharide flippase family protein [Aquabacterium sp. J223]
MNPSRLPLRRRMLSAGGWTIVGHLASLILRMGSSLLTTRFLAPETFGLMAMTTTVMTITGLLTDVGIRENLIRSSRADDPLFRSTAWTVQIARGLVIFLGTCAIALVLSVASDFGLVSPGTTYSDPLLPILISGIAVTSIIGGFHSTKAHIASRNFDLARPVQIELAAQIVGSAVTIFLAWKTRSIWALVVGTLVGSSVAVLLSHLYLEGPKDRLGWDTPSLSEILKFGKWIAVSSAVSVFAVNGDRLLLGALVGPRTLGLYSIAFMLLAAAEGVLMRLISAVAFPALSEANRKGSAEVKALLRKMRLPSDGAMLFFSGLLFVTGSELVDLLYDPRYLEAGAMLEILSLGMVLSRYSLLHQAYMALGHSKYVAAVNIVSVVSLFILVPAGFAIFGVAGAVAAIALRNGPTLAVMLYANKRLGLNDFKLELALTPFWVVGAVVGVVMLKLISAI